MTEYKHSGQHWNTSARNRIGKLTPYQFAVFRQCWKLEKREAALLEFTETCYCSLQHLMDNLLHHVDGDIKDQVIMWNYSYEAAYIDTGYIPLVINSCHSEVKDDLVLLQFRRTINNSISLCLIWMPPKGHRVYENLDRYTRLGS